MRFVRTIAGITGAVFAWATVSALAADGDLGKKEFESNCAVCHGLGGKGDGPYAGLITQKMPDITTLAKRNNGAFPFNRVYEIIDGRTAVKAHGTRDMPIWGNDYNDKAIAYHQDFYRSFDAESFVRSRILALVTYIYSLQQN